jgi:hypothetical protein
MDPPDPGLQIDVFEIDLSEARILREQRFPMLLFALA